MSEAANQINEMKFSRKHRARAAKVVEQFLAIRATLKKAEAGGDEIDDLDEVAAQLTVAVFKPIR